MALIQNGLCSLKRRRLGHIYTLKEDHVTTEGEGGCLQTEERGLGRNQPSRHLSLRLLASRTVKTQFSVIQTACLSHLVHGTQF